MTKYKKTTHDSNPTEVISAKFKLNLSEINKIEEDFGKGVLKEDYFILSKNYKNERLYIIKTSEEKYVKHLAQKLNLTTSTSCDEKFKPVLNEQVKLDELIKILENIEDKTESYNKALEHLKKIKNPAKNLKTQIWNRIEPQLPKFVYFSDYDIMPGHIDIDNLQEKLAQKNIDKSEKAFLSLLSMADATLEDFKNTSFDALNAQIESASAQLTNEVFSILDSKSKFESANKST